jgi:peptidoglycan hydrolase-like protein with peptidoglycan-binding domain
MSRSPSRSRGWWVVAVVVLLVSGGVAWVVGSRVQSPEQAAARASEPVASWVSVGVERRVLASTVVVRGDVMPEVSVAVGVPSSVEGSGVVTRLGPAAGASVPEGVAVVVVSDRPVFVVEGVVPVFRSLSPGMSGDDVAQLQAALVRLGFAPEVDGLFGALTKEAVSAWYASNGFEPVWSEVSLADVAEAQRALDEAEAGLRAAEAALAQVSESKSAVVSAQAAVNEAQRMLDGAQAAKVESVTNAQVVLANAQAALDRVKADPEATAGDREAANAALVAAQTGLSAAVREGDAAIAAASDALTVARTQLSDANAGTAVAAAQAARDEAVAVRDAASLVLWEATVASGPSVPLGEVVFVPSTPVRVRSTVSALGPVGPSGGSEAGGASASAGGLVALEAGGLVVTTSIRSGDEGLVRVGMPVQLLDETTNTTYAATVGSIAADATVDATGVLGRAAVIVPDDELPASLTGVNLRVTVTAAASEGPVLVVPLAAVSAGADGATRVSVLGPGAVDPVEVPVTAGLSADGFVAVEPVDPGGLVEGDLVVVGR